MQFTNAILSSLDIDSSEFLYKKNITLYDKEAKKPFGKVTYENGHYKLTVGDLPDRKDRFDY